MAARLPDFARGIAVVRAGVGGIRVAMPNWWGALLGLLLLGSVLFIGLFSAVFGNLAGWPALYYVAALGLVIVVPIVVLSREDPARFVFTALIVGMPVVTFVVPPGRFGVTVFDYAVLFLLFTILFRRFSSPDRPTIRLFPSATWIWVQVLSIPLVLLALAPGIAAWVWLENFLVYFFFLVVIRELESDEDFQRLFMLFSATVILLALGVLVERLTQINLALRTANLNKLSFSGGVLVYRASGFFQDPQKAAQFFACAGILLFTIALGHRFARFRNRLLVVIACLAAFAALMLTASRSAMIAAAGALPLVVLFGPRSGPIVKLVSLMIFLVLVAVVSLIPVDTLVGALPASVAARFNSLDDSLYFRIKIWLDTWEMFADHPVTGIGLGGFQNYLEVNNPGMRSYMGIGGAAGAGYIPDQPESGYFKILYEGGIIGSLAVLILIGSTLWRGLRVLLSAQVSDQVKSDVTGALLGLFVFGISFSTLFTLSDERNAMILALLLGIVWSRSARLGGRAAGRTPPQVRAAH